MTNPFPYLPNVQVGEVLSVEPHPDADRLTVCTVTVGGDPRTIVCGAPNVAAGQKVAVAPVGATLAGGITLEKRKIRGVVSDGMICAGDELGIGDDHDGIVVLPEGAPVGEPLAEYVGLATRQIKLDITPNRPDALSHIGVARDLSAVLGRELTKPKVTVSESGPAIETFTSVTVNCPTECPRYVARVVEGVTVGPSPDWLTARLRSVGLEPINNIVDVTNYVLHETGHPLHGFDLDKLAEQRIHVRLSNPDESMTTLDGEDRKMPQGTVMICDGDGAVAVGGIMGGERSKVGESTKKVLLEAAYFHPSSIRRSSKTLKLQTDASYRFERGADPNGVLIAIDRAATLLSEVAGGQIADGRIDVYPTPVEPLKIRLRFDRMDSLLGLKVPRPNIFSLLSALEFEVDAQDESGADVLVPTFRPDVTREVDLIEEVARLYGYENVPARLVGAVAGAHVAQTSWAFVKEVRRLLVGAGLTEVMNNSMTSPQTAEKIWHHRSHTSVNLANYSAVDLSVMRTSLVPCLLDVIRHNLNHRASDGLAIFEVGTIYGQLDDRSTVETPQIAVALVGKAGGSRWCDGDRDWDFFDLSGVIQEIFARISLDPPQVDAYADEGGLYGDQSAAISLGDEMVGTMGVISPSLLAWADIDSPVYIAVVDREPIERRRKTTQRATPPPKFPAAERDLALVVDEKVSAGSLVKTLESSGGDWLESVTVFDIYRGQGVSEGQKSVAGALKFRAPDRTLADDEVDEAVLRMIASAEKEHDATVRS